MNQEEKIVAIADRDRAWADLRKHKDKIVDILKGKEHLEPFDFILFFQCATIVLADLTLFDEYTELNDEWEKTLKEDRASGGLLRFLREAGYWKGMEDDGMPNDQRLELISKLRQSIWVNMGLKKDEIINLIFLYPDIDKGRLHLVMQCCAMVALELDMQKKEIELLY